MMDYELMKERINMCNYMEDKLMRTLTNDERNYLMDNGMDKFFENRLGWDADDMYTFERLKVLISAWCTCDYDAFVDELNKDNGYAYYTFRTLANALEHSEKLKEQQERFAKTIAKGGTLEANLPEVTDDEKVTEDDLFGAPGELEPESSCKTNISGKACDGGLATESYPKEVSTPDYKDCDKQPSKVLSIVSKLKNDKCSCKVEDRELLNDVIKYLWDHEDNVNIRVNNNVISAKF